MYKIMEEALKTEGKNLNSVSLAHLKGKVLLSLEKFKIDGDIRTLTVSSAIGLQKKGKKVTLVIPESYVQKEQNKVITVEEPVIEEKIEETKEEVSTETLEIETSEEEKTVEEMSGESDSSEDSKENSEESKQEEEKVEEVKEELEIVIPTTKTNNKKRR